MEPLDDDNDSGDPGQHNRRNWLIVRPIRKQSAANCTEEVEKSVLLLFREKFSPSLCIRSIF